jgi:tungstate transport system ATP-binding protein
MLYKLNKISVFYDKLQALNVDKLQFQQGKIYGIAGANGAGKTTLLKVLNGLLPIADGKIYYKNTLINSGNYKTLNDKSIYVHQNPILFTGTVFANIAYGLKLRKYKKEKIKSIANQYLEMLGLTGLILRKNKNLSQGEIKRVAIARALALQPEVLLLDEPAAHVDEKSLLQIQEVLKKVNRELGTTIIFSSHDNNFNQIADQVITIKNGSLG